MDLIFWMVLEFFGEVLFQVIFEIVIALFDGGLHLTERFTRISLKFILYCVLGSAAAYLSYLFMPNTLSGNPPSIVMSALLIPLAVGFIAMFIARGMERKWDWDLAGSEFGYSFVLAWAFSVTRYFLIV